MNLAISRITAAFVVVGFLCTGTSSLAADKDVSRRPANAPNWHSRLSAPPKFSKPPAPWLLAVEAKFVTFSISPDLVASVENLPSGDAGIVRTVYGETFVCERLSADAIAKLAATNPAAKPGKIVPRKLALDNPPRPIPDGWLAWRMNDGSSFYARPSSKKNGRAAAPALLLQPDKDGFVIQKGSSAGGKAKQPDKLIVELLSANRIIGIPLSDVESARQGLISSLPPPSSVIRGVSPYLSDSIALPGGSFTMGRIDGAGLDDELPPHKVLVSPFRMDSCEVTRGQFAVFVEDSGYKTDAEKATADKTWKNPGFSQSPREPVVCVSWFDAVMFCNWRSRKAGLNPCYETRKDKVSCDRDKNGYRLPTEAEWEYAATAGGRLTNFPFVISSTQETAAAEYDVSEMEIAVKAANFQQEKDEPPDEWLWTSPVMSFPANEFGLYDMAGNVWEWCQDWYFGDAYRAVHSRRPGNPCVEAEDVAGLKSRVMRGGSYENPLEMMRCTTRGNGPPDAFATRVGFRCVRNGDKQE